MIQTWTCEELGSTTECVVTATTTPHIQYSDWLYINSIIIFILSFLVWGYLWSTFKVKK